MRSRGETLRVGPEPIDNGDRAGGDGGTEAMLGWEQV